MQKSNNNNWSPITVIFFVFWFIYFLLFWSKALFYDKAGNIVAGHVNIWGDWAAHFTMGSAMANRGIFLDSSPFLIGAKFSYPFVSDLISAVVFTLSGNFIYSFIVPSFLLSLFFVWAVYYFFKTIWQSEKKAVLSSLVFLLNGGLGFWFYFKEIIANNTLLSGIVTPVHEVTRYDLYSIKWINIIDSMVIPQRAFLLGFPLTLLALTLIYKNFFQNSKVSVKKTLVAGIILGFMPIIHTHSFLAAFIILSFWSIENILNNTKYSFRKLKITSFPRERFKSWLSLCFITSVIALPLLVHYFFGTVDHGFSQFYPGWLAKTYQMNWFEFWWRNWFLVPWLAFVGFFIMARKNHTQLFIFSPFLFIFLIANIWLLQPFAWDNTKLFVWASIGFSYLTIYSLTQMAHTKNRKIPIPQVVRQPFVALIFLLIILSGLMDLHYIVRHDLHSHIMYTKEEIELTNWIRKETPQKAIWLTGDKHNHFVFNLTGRQTVLTYRGWLWTHGYDYLPVEKDVIQMYADPKNSLDLLQKYKIDYIVVGLNEKTVWNADETAFLENFNLIKQTNNYKIFTKREK